MRPIAISLALSALLIAALAGFTRSDAGCRAHGRVPTVTAAGRTCAAALEVK